MQTRTRGALSGDRKPESWSPDGSGRTILRESAQTTAARIRQSIKEVGFMIRTPLITYYHFKVPIALNLVQFLLQSRSDDLRASKQNTLLGPRVYPRSLDKTKHHGNSYRDTSHQHHHQAHTRSTNDYWSPQPTGHLQPERALNSLL